MNTTGPNELADDVEKPLSLSNRILAQAEGMKTDFYTINFARLACADIRVSQHGQRLYSNCFSNLPIFRSADERLQFGWGDGLLLRNIGVQLYEYEHLLLASAMGEFFSEDYAAAVFSALADHFEDDDRPKPHLSSFRGFVHAANGILSCSDFPLVVDDRIRLNPYRDHDLGMPFARQRAESIAIGQLAQALRMLVQIRNGKSTELSMIGGDVLGWFSAFTDMCLGIDVTLLDREGHELHRANAGQTSRLKLIFVPQSTPHTDLQSSSMICLREAFDNREFSNCIPPILTGRISGNALFSKVFGRTFQRLDQTEAKSFANALGGLARVWELLAHKEGISADIISDENKSNPGSHGMGLIQTWTNWFPELRHLQGRMERALKLDGEGAGKLCNESIHHLEPLCGCYICSPVTQSSEQEDSSTTQPTNLPQSGFCIPTLMETIVMLGLSLSRVTLTPNLHPSRSGVLAMYKSQLRKRLSIQKTHATGFDRHKILFGSDWNATYPTRLANIVALFSGSWPPETKSANNRNNSGVIDRNSGLPENLLGLSHEGICAYSLKLQHNGIGKASTANMDDHVIRVVSGSIQWRQKILLRVCLGPPVPPVGVDDGWESVACEHLGERLFFK